MSSVKETVQARLFELQDLKYKEFHCKFVPTISPETVIGVRTPESCGNFPGSFPKRRNQGSSSGYCPMNTMRKTIYMAF
jgi:hypothetical protein